MFTNCFFFFYVNESKAMNYLKIPSTFLMDSQVALVVKNLPANLGDIRKAGWTPPSRRSSGGWHGNPLQYPCLENPIVREAWWATVHRVAELNRTEVTWHAGTYIFTLYIGVTTCVPMADSY